MTHILYIIYRCYGEYVGLIVSEVWVSLDFCCYILKLGTFLQLYINHTAVDTLAQWDCNRECFFDTLLATNANRVSHAHTRTEVGIGQSLWSQTFHQNTYD